MNLQELKQKKLYSDYSINRAMNDKVKQISANVYLVNEKNTVINNKKNLRCDCKWFNDNKGHIKYCHCCLAILHHLNEKDFWEEVSREKNKND